MGVSVQIDYDSKLKDEEIRLLASPNNKNVDMIKNLIENNKSTIIGRVEDRVYFLEIEEIEYIFS